MSADTAVSSLLILGRVFTADPLSPWAEAVLTDGRRISFVGDRDEAQRLAGRATETIEATGMVLPGFPRWSCASADVRRGAN